MQLPSRDEAPQSSVVLEQALLQAATCPLLHRDPCPLLRTDPLHPARRDHPSEPVPKRQLTAPPWQDNG